MAKLRNMPSQAIIDGFKGYIDYYVNMGIPCARSWPRSPGRDRSPAVRAQWLPFSVAATAWPPLCQDLVDAYNRMASGTHMSGKDIMAKGYLSRAHIDVPLAPATPPYKPSDYFHPTSINIGRFSNGICVQLPTNNPCSLSCFHTYIFPEKHPLSRVVRGVSLPWGTRFCFVNPDETPQETPGDTLEHKFVLKALTPDKLIHFVMAGSVDGDPSPSITPIFTHRFTGSPIFRNTSFEHWDYRGINAFFWDNVFAGTGWSKWDKAVKEGSPSPYCTRQEAGGYDRLTIQRQVQDCREYQNQYITAKAWGIGASNVNTCLYLRWDGTPPGSTWSGTLSSSDWTQVDCSAQIPSDATWLWIEVRCHSPGLGPTTAWWDDVTIEC